MAEHNNNRPRGGRGHGPGRVVEKPKNLVGTWKRLLTLIRSYLVIFIIAIVFSIIGTSLTLAGPDKLSDMTDYITEGIQPNTDALADVTAEMQDNISSNMQTVMTEIGANMQAMQMGGMPQDIEVNGVTISAEDQMAAMSVLSELNLGASEATNSDAAASEAAEGSSDMDAAAMTELLAELPASITNAMYSDIVVDGVTISAADQKELVDLMSDLDTEDTDAMLDALDQLPESVASLVKPAMDMDAIVKTGLTLVAFYAAAYFLSLFQGLIMASITQRVSKKLRTDISEKINRLPMSFYNKTTTGDILSRVTNDVDTISQSFNQSIGTMISAIVLFFGSLFMMLKTNVLLTVTAVLASLLGFVIMFAIMGRSQKYFRQQQNSLGALNGHIEEIYTGHTVVKAYNGEKKAIADFDEMNESLRNAAFKAQSLSGLMMPIMTFIGNLGYVAVCVAGGALALNGDIGFGVIVAFMMYVRYFTQPLSQIAQAFQNLQSAAAAGERVFEFLDAEEMENEEGKLTELPDHANLEGAVTFSHVKFGYEDSDEIVIHDFSAEVKPGQKIAIVGPTGAGKTTLVNLLMRFHEIQEGTITIGGVSTKDMTREAVHDQFCMVLQDTWLFEGTIRENLVYNSPDIPDEKIKQACKAVGLHHFIKTLPKGYDTVLNDNVNLSAGQKQQLTIARAMLADKPMLILDEATSSVDTRTEQQIQRAMDELMKDRTSFVIAHRLSTIKNSDMILVLRDGDIVEAGNHDELIAKNGFYAELYNSQFDTVA